MELCKCLQHAVCVLLVFICTLESLATAALTATCNVAVNSALTAGINDSVTGTVTFTQETGGNTTLKILLSGFDTADSYTQHGFHIHSSDNLTTGCNSLGGHYNPTSVNHAGPTAASRHYGDLGNILEDGQGRVEATITDHLVDLSGNYTVISRSIVIHQKQDDLGLGGDAGSLATGNAGSRLACCIITASGSSHVSWSAGPMLLAFCLVKLLTKTGSF